MNDQSYFTFKVERLQSLNGDAGVSWRLSYESKYLTKDSGGYNLKMDKFSNSLQLQLINLGMTNQLGLNCSIQPTCTTLEV